MKTVRKPARAGSFYPASAAAIKDFISRTLASSPDPDLTSASAVAAVAPHAGWPYSGRTALKTVKALLDRSDASTVVFFGAVHAWGVPAPTITSSDYWETPLGTVPVDSELRDAVSESGLPVDIDDHAHAGEHSIEVLLPFVQAFAGNVRILPIAVPPTEDAAALGRGIGVLSEQFPGLVAVASTDLTHYGPDFYGWAPKGTGPEALRWVREENDASIIRLMLEMEAEKILPEASSRRNACGPGAVAAAVSFARSAGAERGVLVEYTTSHDENPIGEPTDFVGYAGVLFVREEQEPTQR